MGQLRHDASEGRFPLTRFYTLVGNVLAPEPSGRTAVVIEDDKIPDVMRSPRSAEPPSKSLEASEFISPGFIDLQIDGRAFGIDVGPDKKASEEEPHSPTIGSG